jgi:hypothetical protein
VLARGTGLEAKTIGKEVATQQGRAGQPAAQGGAG